MLRWKETAEVLAGSLQNRRLWLIQFLANPILFLLFVAWLHIPEAKVWQLILNVVLAAGIAAAALVLHAGTLVYFYDRFRSNGATLKVAFGQALRHLAAVAAWVCAFYLLWDLVDTLSDHLDTIPTYVRSMLPALLRRNISLGVVAGVFDAFVFALRWILTPGLLLPLAVSVAHRGFRGFGRAGWSAWKKAIWSLQYWGIVTGAAIVGVLLSGLITDWTPRSQNPSFTGETISLILRLLIAYLLALFSWMLACSVIGRGCGVSERAPGDSTA